MAVEGSSTSFAVEKAFGEASSQEQVMHEVAPFVRPVVDGFNVCLFAYGQTGSGKTYTMEGEGQGAGRGLITRVIEDLFEIIGRNAHEASYNVAISMVEIYNEQLRDLLSEKGDKVEIRLADGRVR